jgi:hypothetical protein
MSRSLNGWFTTKRAELFEGGHKTASTPECYLPVQTVGSVGVIHIRIPDVVDSCCKNVKSHNAIKVTAFGS